MSVSMTPEQVAEWKELLATIAEQNAKLDADYKTLERRVGRIGSGGGGGGNEPLPLRERLLDAKELKSRPLPAQRGMVVRVPLQTKDILNVSRTIPQFVGGTAPPPVALRVRNLIPSSQIESGAVSWLNETGFVNNAAPVAEGAIKPKSDKTFENRMVPAETVAHYITCSKQTYEDLGVLAALIESNLLYGLDVKLEQQLLKGTGVAPELGPGLYTAAPAAAAPPTMTPPATLIDELFLAGAELSAAGYTATAAVVSAADYAAMQLMKDTTGRYLMGGGLPLPQIVVSPSLATGEWLTGDFQRGSHLWVRNEASVQIASYNEDDFIRNRLTCLAELRLALTSQPSAFRKNGAGVAAAAPPPERSRR